MNPRRSASNDNDSARIWFSHGPRKGSRTGSRATIFRDAPRIGKENQFALKTGRLGRDYSERLLWNGVQCGSVDIEVSRYQLRGRVSQPYRKRQILEVIAFEHLEERQIGIPGSRYNAAKSSKRSRHRPFRNPESEPGRHMQIWSFFRSRNVVLP